MKPASSAGRLAPCVLPALEMISSVFLSGVPLSSLGPGAAASLTPRRVTDSPSPRAAVSCAARHCHRLPISARGRFVRRAPLPLTVLLAASAARRRRRQARRRQMSREAGDRRSCLDARGFRFDGKCETGRCIYGERTVLRKPRQRGLRSTPSLVAAASLSSALHFPGVCASLTERGLTGASPAVTSAPRRVGQPRDCDLTWPF